MKIRNKKKKINIKETIILTAFVLPAVITIFLFNYMPMYGIQLAFREFNFKAGLTGGELVGLKYFKQFIENYQFPILMRNTFFLCLFNIVLSFPAPIIIALLFNQITNKRFKGLLQTVTYMPHFISVVVLVSIMNMLFAPDTGVIGQKIAEMGNHVNLLGSPKVFPWMYIISDVWQHCGWNAIIYLAALSSVDTQLYDACKMDGANRMQIIRYVEVPTLVPTMVILLILSMGGILNANFDKVFLMQNPMNLNASEVISTYVYKVGITSSQISYAAAIGLFSNLINVFFLLVTNTIAKKVSDISII